MTASSLTLYAHNMCIYRRNYASALLHFNIISMTLITVEHCTRAKATGRKLNALRHGVAAHYGAGRPARAAGSPPPCRTWLLLRGWPGPLVSPPTPETVGTAPPSSSRRGSARIYLLVTILIYECWKAYLFEDRELKVLRADYCCK